MFVAKSSATNSGLRVVGSVWLGSAYTVTRDAGRHKLWSDAHRVGQNLVCIAAVNLAAPPLQIQEPLSATADAIRTAYR